MHQILSRFRGCPTKQVTVVGAHCCWSRLPELARSCSADGVRLLRYCGHSLARPAAAAGMQWAWRRVTVGPEPTHVAFIAERPLAKVFAQDRLICIQEWFSSENRLNFFGRQAHFNLVALYLVDGPSETRAILKQPDTARRTPASTPIAAHGLASWRDAWWARHLDRPIRHPDSALVPA